MLSIDVLGSVIIGDGRAKFSKKAQALLAYLACRNECVPRVILADLLWPYKEHNLALHSLRNCLVDTRKALGPLDSKSLQCGFTDCSLRDFRCDLHQIRNAIAGKIRFSETVAL
jgi:DNA-binding SARP family transcriptional activator